ncbi:hypothetical protein Tco_1541890 [Tanacetum coccineum]
MKEMREGCNICGGPNPSLECEDKPMGGPKDEEANYAYEVNPNAKTTIIHDDSEDEVDEAEKEEEPSSSKQIKSNPPDVLSVPGQDRVRVKLGIAKLSLLSCEVGVDGSNRFCSFVAGKGRKFGKVAEQAPQVIWVFCTICPLGDKVKRELTELVLQGLTLTLTLAFPRFSIPCSVLSVFA